MKKFGRRDNVAYVTAVVIGKGCRVVPYILTMLYGERVTRRVRKNLRRHLRGRN